MPLPTVLDCIGRTPVIRLQRMAPAGVDIHLKLEGLNPAGSVKDRAALGMIEAAERSGALRPGQTVVEATSGNTGIALAMVCAARGYPLVVVMAENFSVERRRLMRRLGARVVLTPAALKGSGMIAKARELADAHGWFWCNQFANPANAEIHARTTAREILDSFRDRRLDWWVTGAGTGGSLNGIGRMLRAERPDCRIAVCEPDNAPVLSRGRAHPAGADSHPDFRPHPVQGWTPDFIPELTAQARRAGFIDRWLAVSGDDALACARELARREGILTGISGGATLAGALALARGLPVGSSVLCLMPDSGERYQSTPLFEDIEAEMNDEEWAIACSTPGARMDQPGAAPPLPAPVEDAEADARLDALIGERTTPLLMFGLGWCEFCWSVSRLFKRCGLRHRVVNLDDPALASGDLGARLRARLQSRTGVTTLPQVFLGGRFLGGCSETFGAFNDGSLAAGLEALGHRLRMPAGLDPTSLLPRWLHGRSAAATPRFADEVDAEQAAPGDAPAQPRADQRQATVEDAT